MRKLIFLVALVSILSFAAVACGSDSSGNAAAGVKVINPNSVVDAADFSVSVVRNVDGDLES